jgi:GTP cyclohydrolase II
MRGAATIGCTCGAHKIKWGAPTAQERGPVIVSPTCAHHNVIGARRGPYSVYEALSVATGRRKKNFRPDLTQTEPTASIPFNNNWADPNKIVIFDPRGHLVKDDFAKEIADGIDIRPSIAITRAHLLIPEIKKRMKQGALKADGTILFRDGNIPVTKAAIEQVWHLPGIAKRLGITEKRLRESLYLHTGGMFEQMITRPDLKVYLPPIGSITVYFFGDVEKLGKPDTKVAARVHDLCSGSDIFGSDICTCRPYLMHAVEECIKMAQKGGVGIVVHMQKEGRCLGEIDKFLVYNKRKRRRGGDTPANYFRSTMQVAGMEDARFQELSGDVFHWLGVHTIHRWVSMSNLKSGALRAAGITILKQVEIPKKLIPKDAKVEMLAKIEAGYASKTKVKDLNSVQGRSLTNEKRRSKTGRKAA